MARSIPILRQYHEYKRGQNSGDITKDYKGKM
jgi:hypothetical protein